MIRLLGVYRRLEAAYASYTWHWAPGYIRDPLDVVVGAILVQHTTWTNAERALERLREAGALDVCVLASMPQDELAAFVRVSGAPTVKARRLRAIASTIEDAGGLDALFALPLEDLRARLLATHGVGPETADAIALYAACQPAFIIDAYTRRLFSRLGAEPQADSYDAWQRHFEDELAEVRTVELYQRYHAYIVLHGKRLCRAAPLCGDCPLLQMCNEGRARVSRSGQEHAAAAR